MPQQEKKPEKVTSPVAPSLFPKLTEPDFKFDPVGKFSVKLLFDPSVPAHKAFLDKLEAAYEDAYQAAVAENKEAKKKPPKKADKPWSDHADSEGNLTGMVAVNFSRKATGVSKKTGKPWTATVDVFDSRLKPIPADVAIWSGSEMQVAFNIIPFNQGIGAGVSLRLMAARIIKLVAAGQRDAASYGFEDDGEDGFSYDHEADDAPAGDAAAGGPEAGDF